MSVADHYTSLPGEAVGGADGHMLWTGPNGISDYKADVVSDYEYVGETVAAASNTTSTKFLTRAAPSSTHPPKRGALVGEVGWMVDDAFHNQVNQDSAMKGNNIQLKLFRTQLEERHIHQLQNPYVPAPGSGESKWPDTVGPNPARLGISGYPAGMSLRESQGFAPATVKASPAASVAESVAGTECSEQ